MIESDTGHAQAWPARKQPASLERREQTLMRTPLNTKMILRWTDIAGAAYALGIIPDNTKGVSLKLREEMLKSGRVTQVARGRYQLNKTTADLLAGR
jgi:hypothetical protein